MQTGPRVLVVPAVTVNTYYRTWYKHDWLTDGWLLTVSYVISDTCAIANTGELNHVSSGNRDTCPISYNTGEQNERHQVIGIPILDLIQVNITMCRKVIGIPALDLIQVNIPMCHQVIGIPALYLIQVNIARVSLENSVIQVNIALHYRTCYKHGFAEADYWLHHMLSVVYQIQVNLTMLHQAICIPALYQIQVNIALTLNILLVANLTNTKRWKNTEKWLNPLHMGTHLRVLNKHLTDLALIWQKKWLKNLNSSMYLYLCEITHVLGSRKSGKSHHVCLFASSPDYESSAWGQLLL